jgi:PKD repeat protein
VFPAVGAYTVALTVMAADGTSYGTAHAVFVGGIAPVVAFSGGGGIEGLPIAFSASATLPTPGATISSYRWTFGDGTTGNGPSPSHAFARPGAYTVTLIATDSYGQVSSAVSHTVLVFDEAPSAAFRAPSGRARIRISFTGAGSDPDGAITSYAWTFGDGASASGAHVRHTYRTAGHYTVRLKLTDSSGQSTTVSHVVTIGPARCVVPKLKGDSLRQARSLLSAAQCSLGRVTSPRKPHRSAGKHRQWVLVVAGTHPGAGAVKPRGTKVALKMTWKAQAARVRASA